MFGVFFGCFFVFWVSNLHKNHHRFWKMSKITSDLKFTETKPAFVSGNNFTFQVPNIDQVDQGGWPQKCSLCLNVNFQVIQAVTKLYPQTLGPGHVFTFSKRSRLESPGLVCFLMKSLPLYWRSLGYAPWSPQKKGLIESHRSINSINCWDRHLE